eukprot:IDg4147t1
MPLSEDAQALLAFSGIDKDDTNDNAHSTSRLPSTSPPHRASSNALPSCTPDPRDGHQPRSALVLMPNVMHALKPSKTTRKEPSTRRGRGISWNDDENTALAMVANEVCSDPARGNDMKQAKFNRLLRIKFVDHELKPALAGTGDEDGS